MGPWKPQQAYLTDAFANAQDVYNSTKDDPFYQGTLYAGMNDMQSGAANAAYSSGMNTLGMSSPLMAAGMEYGVGGLPTYNNVASNLATGNFNQGSTLANNLLAGNTGYALGQANMGLSGALNNALTNPTAYNQANAAAYANNPVVNGMIDASLRDVARNLNQNTLPAQDAAAIRTGNLNSSRAGVAEALAIRDAADRGADIASQIRSDAYNRGLALSEQGRVANMQGALSGGQLGATIAGQGATGENNTNTLNLANLGVQAQGAGLLGQGLNYGLNSLSTGSGLASQGANLAQQAGGLFQTDAQNAANAAYQQWQGQQAQNWSPLQNYYNLIGATNWGQSGTQNQTSTTTSNMSPMQGILATASTVASMFGKGGPMDGSIQKLWS